MEKIRVGFVPSHRDPFDESWAIEMRGRTLKALSTVNGLEVIVPDGNVTKKGLVRDDEDAERTIELFEDRGIDGLIIGTMTFGDEISALRIASAFQDLPILLFGTKEGPFTPEGGRRSDSFCGTLSISSGLYRRGIPFTFAGIIFPEEEVFLDAVRRFMRVCSIVKGFIGANIGLVGPRPERFETCIFSEDAMVRWFGQRVVTTSLTDILNRAEGVSGENPEVKEIIDDMKSEADLSMVSDEALMKMAKLEYALRSFVRERNLAGIGFRCWTEIQEMYGISPCYVMGRMTDRGVMMACEVDIYGVLTMLIQYLATLKERPPHFIDWTIRHQKEENVFLAWHCGNAPPSLACEGCRVKVSYHEVLSRVLSSERTVGTCEFQLREGEVTICRLIEDDGAFKMLITKGEILRSEDELRGSWSWVKVKNLDLLYRTLVEEGFIHHASLIHGDYVDVISEACKFLGIETVIV